jgi:methenyltetrahydromethanopterin cyclohydrolase
MVRSSEPVVACLACQYAGWRLSEGKGKDAFFALGSGPARALARVEPLFEELGYQDKAPTATLVLESSRPPPAALVAKVADDCRLTPDKLTLIYAPTQSLAGGVQVVARVLEVALHKAHELKFPLERVVEGLGAAPLSPPHPDLVTAMGRTNDAIIYGGRVQLFVRGSDGDAKQLAEQLPSSSSSAYGQPFAEIFAAVGGDFYKIDGKLFSPARVTVSNLDTGASFHAGHPSHIGRGGCHRGARLVPVLPAWAGVPVGVDPDLAAVDLHGDPHAVRQRDHKAVIRRFEAHR